MQIPTNQLTRTLSSVPRVAPGTDAHTRPYTHLRCNSCVEYALNSSRRAAWNSSDVVDAKGRVFGGKRGRNLDAMPDRLNALCSVANSRNLAAHTGQKIQKQQ